MGERASPAEMVKYREAELKHGRVAMLAITGMLFAEVWHPMLYAPSNVPAIFAFQGTLQQSSCPPRDRRRRDGVVPWMGADGLQDEGWLRAWLVREHRGPLAVDQGQAFCRRLPPQGGRRAQQRAPRDARVHRPLGPGAHPGRAAGDVHAPREGSDVRDPGALPGVPPVDASPAQYACVGTQRSPPAVL